MYRTLTFTDKKGKTDKFKIFESVNNNKLTWLFFFYILANNHNKI
jgi:hypothetical protein